jgi:uncharacterized membrane protein YraQ (UPF0718 family)
MNSGFIILLVLFVVLLAAVLRREPAAIRPVAVNVRRQLTMIFMRTPFALITAAYLGLIIPPDAMSPYIGDDSGLRGIVLAALFGAIIPGGPVMTFPLALVLWRSGAGEAQMVALLTGWTVIAIQRSLTFEVPLVGMKFAGFRLASSWMMPILAGLIGLLLVPLLP